MQDLKFIKTSLWVSGVTSIFIGAIHNFFAIAFYQKVLTILSKKQAVSSTYFFAVMGATVILIGILEIYNARVLSKGEKYITNVTVWAALFNTILQVGAMASGMVNLLIIILGLSQLFLAIVLVAFKNKAYGVKSVGGF